MCDIVWMYVSTVTSTTGGCEDRGGPLIHPSDHFPMSWIIHFMRESNSEAASLRHYTSMHTLSLSLSLSLRFNDDFPSGPGLAGARMTPFTILLELRMTDVQSSSQNVTSNKPTPSFLQAGCPSCRPTMQQHQGTEWKLYMHSLYQ